MKDNEKKVNAAEEEAKKDVKVEEDGEKLTDEEMSSVAAGFARNYVDQSYVEAVW